MPYRRYAKYTRRQPFRQYGAGYNQQSMKKNYPFRRKGYRQSTSVAQSGGVKALLQTYEILRRDTMLGASSMVTPDHPATGSCVWTWNNAVNIWCPSFRPYDGYQRKGSDCLFVGVKEHLQIRVPTNTTCAIRRVVFISRVELSQAMPWVRARTTARGEQVDKEGVLFRPMHQHPLSDKISGDNTATSPHLASGEGIVDEILLGKRDVDWNLDTCTRQPMDSSKVKVLSDRVYKSNAESFWELDFWHPINEVVSYDDRESGVTNLSTGWASVGRSGQGNVYIMMFLEKEGEGSPTITFNSTVYWRERS